MVWHTSRVNLGDVASTWWKPLFCWVYDCEKMWVCRQVSPVASPVTVLEGSPGVLEGSSGVLEGVLEGSSGVPLSVGILIEHPPG